MTSGLNHPSGSTVVLLEEIGEEGLEEDRASRRVGCWRLARRTPVDMLSVRGTACRRRAPRQRAIVAMFVSGASVDFISVAGWFRVIRVESPLQMLRLSIDFEDGA